MFYDREAEACAAAVSRATGIDPIETLGQPRNVLRRDPLTGIMHLEEAVGILKPKPEPGVAPAVEDLDPEAMLPLRQDKGEAVLDHPTTPTNRAK